MTRTKYKLTPCEIDSFRNAVHLFFANKFVKEHNHERLRDVGSPVTAINIGVFSSPPLFSPLLPSH